MSRKAISVRVLKKVVREMGDVFTTKDVSEDPRVMGAHRRLVKHSHYHAFVGGALSDHRKALGIDEVQKQTVRGSRWEKKRGASGFFRRKPETPPEAVEQPPVRKTVGDDQVRKTVEHKVRIEVVHLQEPGPEKVVSLACPSCGGNLKNEAGTRRYLRSHCGSEFEGDS